MGFVDSKASFEGRSTSFGEVREMFPKLKFNHEQWMEALQVTCIVFYNE